MTFDDIFRRMRLPINRQRHRVDAVRLRLMGIGIADLDQHAARYLIDYADRCAAAKPAGETPDPPAAPWTVRYNDLVRVSNFYKLRPPFPPNVKVRR